MVWMQKRRWYVGIIARRHGHVFRMALHNEGDWRMETWQRARQGELSCLHTPTPELCNAILNTWQMPPRSYIIPSNVNKSQTHLLKPFLARDLIWWRAIYAGKTRWSLLWCFVLNCVHAPPHVLSLPSCCEKSDSWRQARSVKTAKKVMNGTTMLSCDTELCTNGAEATKCWVFIAHFSIYSTSRCRCHAGTGIPRLRGHTLQINQVVCTVRHRISCCAPTVHWKCDAQIQNRQIKSPAALWKHLSFQCLGVIVALNGKSASMLLEPTKNKLKQWRVIEKSVNNCNFFPDILKLSQNEWK